MNIAAILLAYAVALTVAGPALLRRATWLDRAPRLAIAAWQALSAAVVLAVVLAGLTLVIPVSVVSSDLALFLNACVMMLRSAYATPGGALIATTGLIAAATVAVLACYGVGAELLASGRDRRRHLAVLDVVARRDDGLGALVLDHEIATAYCLPGRGGRIVLTTSTLDALGERQVAAVLAHERAHLRARHHLVIATARGLHRAFRPIPLFRAAVREISRLTELAADDAAVKATGRLMLAEALVTLADGDPAPRPALAASGGNTAQRVRRLLIGPVPLRLLATAPGVVVVLAVMVAPVAVAIAPALAAAGQNYCIIS